MADWVTAYAQAIEAGAVTVSKKVATIYARLAKEIRDHPERFDAKKAERPIRFIETFCQHSKGKWAGQTVTLELWQKALVSAFFGFVDDKGKRRYRELFLACGRKCGKSTLMAAILLYLFIGAGESGAEVYTLATKLDQAKCIFDEAYRMVSQDPYLAKKVKKRRTDLYNPATFSKFQPLGSRSNTLDGLNSSAICADEFHAWDGVNGRNLYEVMKQSQSTREEPALFVVTTAGTVRGGVYDDLYDLATKVLDGIIEDETFLPIVYELDDAETEWDKEEAWYKANPALGTIKGLEDMRAKYQRALEGDPSFKRGFLCKDLNAPSTTATAWLSYQELNNEKTFDLSDFKGCYCIAGADLSITTDLTATCLLFYRDGEFYAAPQYWIPEDNVPERERRDKIPYSRWHETEGPFGPLVRYCHGNTIDYADVTQWFAEVLNEHDITPLWCYYDPYSARY